MVKIKGDGMLIFTDFLYLKVCHTKENYIMPIFELISAFIRFRKKKVIDTFK